MHYQEKVAAASDIAERMLQGESRTALVAELEQQLYGKDVKDIMRKADTIYLQKGIEAVKAQPGTITEGQTLTAYPNLSPQSLVELREAAQADEIRYVRRILEVEMTKYGGRLEESASRIKSDILTQEEILMIAQSVAVQRKSQQREEVEVHKRNTQKIVIGALLCGGGLLATIVLDGFIFYGAMLVGAWMIFQGLANKEAT